jgi:hypothetical protein
MEIRNDAKAFVTALQKDKSLRQEVFSVPREHMKTVAEKHGYHASGKELYDAMRDEWADRGKVPPSNDVKEDDDPDTCCACTFSESPDF